MLRPTRFNLWSTPMRTTFRALSILALTAMLGVAQEQGEEKPAPVVVEEAEHLKLNREGADLYKKNDFEGAAKKFEAALDSLDRARIPVPPVILSNFVAARVGVAGKKIDRGEFQPAERLLRDTLRRAPKNSSVEMWMGILYYRRGLHRAAQDHLLEAVRHDEKNAGAHFYLGLVEYKRELLQKAIDSWELAAKLEPKRKKDIESWVKKARRELAIESGMQSENSSHFVCKFGNDRDREIARRVLNDLEKMYNDLGQRFDTYPSDALTVIIYSDREFSSATGAQGWVGGLFDGKVRVPVKNFDKRQKILFETLRHEYTHFLVRKLSRRCPAWLNEGLAQLSEGKSAAAVKRELAAYAEAKKLMPMSSLQKSFATQRDARKVRLAYQQSLSLTAALIKRSSMNEVVSFLRQLDRAPSFEDRFSRSFRISSKEFYATWAAGLLK